MDIDKSLQLSEPMAEDLMKGAIAIANFLGVNKRRAIYLLEGGELPAFKIGGRWHMRRSTFRTHIARLEANAGKAA